MQHIVIIGAGLSGLSTAYYLLDKSRAENKPIKVTIIERDSRAGGKIYSHRENGFLYEYGPNGFLTNKPQTLELCNKLGINNLLLMSNDNARKRFVVSGGKLHKLPHSQKEFLTNPLISFSGKLRIAKEFFIAKQTVNSDESLKDFAIRRLGSEAYSKLIAPMASGIFAGNPVTMSLKSCFPRIHQLEQEYGSLIKAMLALSKQKKKANPTIPQASPAGPGGVLTSFENGIEVLTRSLVNSIGKENILYNQQVDNIKQDSDKWIVQFQDRQIVAERLIFATPAYASSQMLYDFDEQLSLQLSKIKYAPLAVVCLTYDIKDIANDINGFGYLFADGEIDNVLGTLWDSSIFASRAPDGKILFRSMLGGAKYPDILEKNDDELIYITKSAIERLMGVSKPYLTAKIYRHQTAIPQYNIGHSDIISAIENQLSRYTGLHISGNALYGVGINDCVAQAEKLAVEIIDNL